MTCWLKRTDDWAPRLKETDFSRFSRVSEERIPPPRGQLRGGHRATGPHIWAYGLWGDAAAHRATCEIVGELAHMKPEAGNLLWLGLDFHPAALLLYTYGMER